MTDRQKAVLGLSIILGLEFLFFLTACAKYLVPAYLDGFQYFHLQYFLLNHQIIHKEPALWFPYLTHGVSGVWWYAMVANFNFQVFSMLASVAAPITKSINFIHIFQFGIFLDHILLLVGTWLLAGRLFRHTSTRFFIAVTVLGSCVWPAQIWFNFHFYYAIPLMIYLGHKFLDTQQWRYLFLMGNLLALQTMGNLPYFIPVITFTLFVYFATWGLLNFQTTLQQLKRLKINGKALLCVTGILASLAGSYAMLSFNSEDIVHSNYARGEDKSSNLGVFLTYGRNTGPQKWLETLTGYSPFVDINLFCGVLTVALFFVALFNIRRNTNNHLLLTLLILAALSAGSIVSIAAFYGWPMMKFFRHLAFISVLVKIFAIFFAAEGWDNIIKHNGQKECSLPLIMISVVFGLLSGLLLIFQTQPERTFQIVASIVQGSIEITPDGKPHYLIPGLSSHVQKTELAETISIIFATSCLFALIGIIGLISRKPSTISRIMLMYLMAHSLSLYGYKLTEVRKRTFSIADISQTTQFTPMPYKQSRIPFLWISDDRDKILTKFSMPQNYWTVNLFLFKDELGQTFQTDHWMLPFNAYIKNYSGQDIDNSPLKKKVITTLSFPQNTAAAKISGLSEQKIQFFQHVYSADDKTTAEAIKHTEYSGDFIFISDAETSVKPWTDNLSPNKNFRLQIPYQIVSFHANQVEINVDVPGESAVWMHYADIWDKNWTAQINGQKTKIFKSNLAYKAVKLNPGHNHIVFRYDLPLWKTLYLVWNIISLIWLAGIIRLLIGLFRKPPDRTPLSANPQ